LGLTPSGAASNANGLNLLASQFNSLLAAELELLQSTLGVTIHQLDVNSIVVDGITSPEEFGFTNVTDPAVATDLTDPLLPTFGFPTFPISVVPNPNGYVFWDGVHPSARAHAIIGNAAALLVVPEPGSAVYAIVGTIILISRVRAVGVGRDATRPQP
jgi:phospholipase/lecithinase/hemolysin